MGNVVERMVNAERVEDLHITRLSLLKSVQMHSKTVPVLKQYTSAKA